MRTKNILNYSLVQISVLLNVDRETAKQIKGLISGKIDPMLFDAVSKWVSQCHNTPRDCELIHEALNALLGTCGVESMEIGGKWIDPFFRYINFLYMNNGQSYDNTIIFDCDTWKYFIGTTGDITEYFDRTP